MPYGKIHLLISLFPLIFLPSAHAETLAPISGFAHSFILETKIANATITVLETGQSFETDPEGHFGPFLYPVGKAITLEFKKFGYKTTQIGTTIVPPKGLTSPYDNLTFQIPSIETFLILSWAVGAKFDADKCHVVTTITKFHKTMEDHLQGEPGAQIVLTPYVDETPYYFGIFTEGPFKGKTNPFPKGLTATTEDGGAGFVNLPPRDEPYTVTATKEGVDFTSAQFICRPGAFINISPPRGPMAIK